MIEKNKIYCEDCLVTLSRMEDSSIDLIVTSPPYNKGYWSSNRNMKNGFGTKSRRIEYDGYNDCMLPHEYDEWQRKVITECFKSIKTYWYLFSIITNPFKNYIKKYSHNIFLISL